MLRHVRNTGTVWALVGTLLAGLLLAGPALAQQAGGQRPSEDLWLQKPGQPTNF